MPLYQPIAHKVKVEINGTTAAQKLVAFYYPGHESDCDIICKAMFLSNFYPSTLSVTIDNIEAKFHNSEAAFQATKWWYKAGIRSQFENASTGSEAYGIKKNLVEQNDHGDSSYAKLGPRGAMKTVLIEKFKDPDLQKGLLATKDAYLLEHNEIKGRDHRWSDDQDGTGFNWLGLTLMEVREHYGGAPKPPGNYLVKDFTLALKKIAIAQKT